MLTEARVRDMLTELQIPENNHTEDTPRRVVKLWTEVLSGLYEPQPRLTVFRNTEEINQMLTIGPIAVRGCCAHHLAPVMGNVWVGYIPGDSLLGLSKFHRIAQWCFARPTVQEHALKHLGDVLEETLQPVGLAIVARCDHLCVSWRGVRGQGTFVSNELRGVISADPAARAEFLHFVSAQGFQ